MTRKIWTPGGDVPVGDEQPGGAAPPPQGQGATGAGPVPPGPVGAAGPADAGQEPTEEEIRAALEQLRQIPVANFIVEHAMTLYNVAAVHLSHDELGEAKLAIDGLAGMLERTHESLGDAGTQLTQILQQLQVHFVERAQAAQSAAESGPAGAQEGGGDTPGPAS